MSRNDGDLSKDEQEALRRAVNPAPRIWTPEWFTVRHVTTRELEFAWPSWENGRRFIDVWLLLTYPEDSFERASWSHEDGIDRETWRRVAHDEIAMYRSTD